MGNEGNAIGQWFAARMLRHGWLGLVAAVCICLVGWLVSPFAPPSAWSLPVDALPDLGDNQQLVITEWEAGSASEVLSLCTAPLEKALGNLPGLAAIRSEAMHGLAVTYLVFEDNYPPAQARSDILERLSQLKRTDFPVGTQFELGPNANALGQVYAYTLEGRDTAGMPTPGWSLATLRDVEEEVVASFLERIEGVEEVAHIGGATRKWMLMLRPERLAEAGITPKDVEAALYRSGGLRWHSIVLEGGAMFEIPTTSNARPIPEWGLVMVPNMRGDSFPLSYLAHIHQAPGHAHGMLDKSGAAAVGGIVTMEQGQNAMEVLQHLHEAVDSLNRELPSILLPGGNASQVQIVPYYDRSRFITASVATLAHSLWLELLVTGLVVLFFAMSLRESLAVMAVLPVAVLGSLMGMRLLGLEANVVSLGGIAIAIGTMVDMGIVLAERIAAMQRAAKADTPAWQTLWHSLRSVAPAILSSTSITLLSFLPVLLMQGEEGKLFSLMAITKTMAIVFALLLTFVLVPVLSHIGRKGVGAKPSRLQLGLAVAAGAILAGILAHEWRPLGPGYGYLANVVVTVLPLGLLLGGLKLLQRYYARILNWCLGRPLTFLAVPMAMVVMALVFWLGLPSGIPSMHQRFPGLGHEFLPAMDEGDFLYMPMCPDSATEGEIRRMLALSDMAFTHIPEVELVVGKAGRAQTALDPAPMQMLETVLKIRPEWELDAFGQVGRYRVDGEGNHILDASGRPIADADGTPFRNWRSHIHSKDDIWAEIQAAAHLPGLRAAPRMGPVATRQAMLRSGVQAPLAIAVRGAVHDSLIALAEALAEMLSTVPEVATGSVWIDKGMPVMANVTSVEGRDWLERNGWSTLLNGHQTLGRVYDDNRGILEVEMHLPHPEIEPDFAGSGLPVFDGSAARRLSEVLPLKAETRPGMLRRENGLFVVYVFLSGQEGVGLSDLATAVEGRLAHSLEHQAVRIPNGYRVELVGDHLQDRRARLQLMVIVPVVLVLTFLILWVHFGKWQQALMVYAGVGLAMAGGMWLIWLYGQPWFMDFEIGGRSAREWMGIHPLHLSVAVWLGFVSLIGIATEDGVVMGSFLKQEFARTLPKDWSELRSMVLSAAQQRLRPCLMTTATTLVALMPILGGRGAGSEIMLPMAVPVFGGMALQLVTVLVVPVLYARWQAGRLGIAIGRKWKDILLGGVFFLATLAGGWGLSNLGHNAEGPERWTCPMDPQVVSDEPDKCPVCGMSLVQELPVLDQNNEATLPPLGTTNAAVALAKGSTVLVQPDVDCDAGMAGTWMVPAGAMFWRGDSAYLLEHVTGRSALAFVPRALGVVMAHSGMVEVTDSSLWGAEVMTDADDWADGAWWWGRAGGRFAGELPVRVPDRIHLPLQRPNGLADREWEEVEQAMASVRAAVAEGNVPMASLEASLLRQTLQAQRKAWWEIGAGDTWLRLSRMADHVSGTKSLETMRAVGF